MYESHVSLGVKIWWYEDLVVCILCKSFDTTMNRHYTVNYSRYTEGETSIHLY